MHYTACSKETCNSSHKIETCRSTSIANLAIMSGRGDGAQGRAGDGQLGLHDGAAQHQLRHLPPRADPRLARPQVARLRPSPLPERMLRRRPSGQRRRRGGGRGGHRNAASRAEWKCRPRLSDIRSIPTHPWSFGTDLISISELFRLYIWFMSLARVINISLTFCVN